MSAGKIAEYFQYSRQKAAEGHLPVHRQLFEMLLLYLRRGLGPGYYHFGRFWRREIPLRDKLRHLNEADYQHAVARLNPEPYQKFSQHKVAEKALLNALSVPTPTFYGHLHRIKGVTAQGDRLTNAEELEAWLLYQRVDRVCLKPVEGWGGSGFLALACSYRQESVELRLLDQTQSLSVSEFFREQLSALQHDAAWILEAYCEQHPWYAALNSTSLNTIRLYARLASDNSVEMLGAYLRIGRGGSVVDNASAGGVFCLIDLATGTLAPARINEYDSPDVPQHPDNGIQLAGAVLPLWEDVLALARHCVRVFPGVRFAGLDIALTPTGPVIIELNVEPGRTAACDIDLPTLDMLDPQA